ncbi:unnamed protein product [Chrysodeixis includens]|uniref:Uncharacterized protein n=1 Tax=Chrysodeixis includens TaxID=689277 RepID=A0A9N8L1W9_CHRIL|nr:unnamed protein product [Chrysodeixis includens]
MEMANHGVAHKKKQDDDQSTSEIVASDEEQCPDDAKVKLSESVACDVVQEVRVLSETLLKLRVWEVAQLLEELGIEARRRRGARPARAPRARARTALRRDAPEPRPSAPPASRRRRLPYADRSESLSTLTNDFYAQCVRSSVSYELN